MRNKKKFNEFMNKTIEELKDEKRYGTAHIYQSTLKHSVNSVDARLFTSTSSTEPI